ncbi:hypothetical protein NRB20_49610 [Nocardia sp. RB20]|uniref:Uncharacterized protein n=1 Tax=Nocardia macrotermitis TaxID=2585198 RepID=A0A7K0D803_9NOCA|nr:hypothetical protein [Nocardia macrotermitis]
MLELFFSAFTKTLRIVWPELPAICRQRCRRSPSVCPENLPLVKNMPLMKENDVHHPRHVPTIVRTARTLAL